MSKSDEAKRKSFLSFALTLPHARVVSGYMQGEMARQSLSTGGKLGLFVGCLLGVDVIGLEHPKVSGPVAPAIGAAVAALIVTARKGTTAIVRFDKDDVIICCLNCQKVLWVLRH